MRACSAPSAAAVSIQLSIQEIETVAGAGSFRIEPRAPIQRFFLPFPAAEVLAHLDRVYALQILLDGEIHHVQGLYYASESLAPAEPAGAIPEKN